MEYYKINQKKYGKIYSVAVIVAYFIYLIYAGINTGKLTGNNDPGLDVMLVSLFQPLTFLIIAIVTMNANDEFIKDGLFINKFKPKYLGYSAILFVGLFLGIGYLNVILGYTLEGWGLLTTAQIEINGISDFIKYFIGLSLAPAVGEEVLFRGVILYALLRYTSKNNDRGDVKTNPFATEGDRFGTDGRTDIKIALINALLFAVYHKNVAQLIYQFVYGFALTLVVIRSGSIIPAIFMHALNNFTILLLTWVGVNPLNIITTVIGLVILVFGFILLLKGKPFKTESGEDFDSKPFFTMASIGIAFCVIIPVLDILIKVFKL